MYCCRRRCLDYITAVSPGSLTHTRTHTRAPRTHARVHVRSDRHILICCCCSSAAQHYQLGPDSYTGIKTASSFCCVDRILFKVIMFKVGMLYMLCILCVILFSKLNKLVKIDSLNALGFSKTHLDSLSTNWSAFSKKAPSLVVKPFLHCP